MSKPKETSKLNSDCQYVCISYRIQGDNKRQAIEYNIIAERVKFYNTATY